MEYLFFPSFLSKDRTVGNRNCIFGFESSFGEIKIETEQGRARKKEELRAKELGR